MPNTYRTSIFRNVTRPAMYTGHTGKASAGTMEYDVLRKYSGRAKLRALADGPWTVHGHATDCFKAKQRNNWKKTYKHA